MAVLFTEVPKIGWKNSLGGRINQEFTYRNTKFEKPGRLVCRWAFGNCNHRDCILNRESRWYHLENKQKGRRGYETKLKGTPTIWGIGRWGGGDGKGDCKGANSYAAHKSIDVLKVKMSLFQRVSCQFTIESDENWNVSIGFGGMEVTGLVESSFSGVVGVEARLEWLRITGRWESRDKYVSTILL